jgi:hypothetical protein
MEEKAILLSAAADLAAKEFGGDDVVLRFLPIVVDVPLLDQDALFTAGVIGACLADDPVGADVTCIPVPVSVPTISRVLVATPVAPLALLIASAMLCASLLPCLLCTTSQLWEVFSHDLQRAQTTYPCVAK